jgi:hypothetical protein
LKQREAALFLSGIPIIPHFLGKFYYYRTYAVQKLSAPGRLEAWKIGKFPAFQPSMLPGTIHFSVQVRKSYIIGQPA